MTEQPSAEEKVVGCETVEDWYSKAETNCNPCWLGALTGWYAGALVEGGYDGLADEVETAYHNGVDEGLATLLDSVRGTVDNEDVREKLANLTCFVQELTKEAASDG